MRRKVTDLFIEGYLSASQGKPVWMRVLPLVMWVLLYVVLIVVLACLAYIYDQKWLYLCDAGFVLMLFGVIGVVVEYWLRHKKEKCDVQNHEPL